MPKKAKPIIIDPQEWLTTANKRSPKNPDVTEWFSGETNPEKPDYYERHFTDGTMRQWWDGKVWRRYNPAEKQDRSAHWRQVGDYPCWRGILVRADACSGLA